MSIGFLIGATRARAAVMVAGLAWFVGLDAPLPIRLAIGALVLVALTADGLLDEQRIAHHTNDPAHTATSRKDETR